MNAASLMLSAIISRSRIALLLLLFGLQGVVLSPLHADGTFDLTHSDDLLSLQANNASLVAIVDRLQELTDIPISFSEPFDNRVSVDLEEVDIETLINTLVKNNLITKLDFQSHITVAEILLMPEGSGGSDNLASLPSGEPAEAVVVDDTAQTVEEAEQNLEETSEVNVVNTSTTTAQ